mmetsp:Transcript_42475/g.108714  ORF Transcript_42475/g.108714 Transcript_42475/m.108714 type:complete len:244 (+) Transcript_42475:1284-2015(+)
MARSPTLVMSAPLSVSSDWDSLISEPLKAAMIAFNPAGSIAFVSMLSRPLSWSMPMPMPMLLRPIPPMPIIMLASPSRCSCIPDMSCLVATCRMTKRSPCAGPNLARSFFIAARASVEDSNSTNAMPLERPSGCMTMLMPLGLMACPEKNCLTSACVALKGIPLTLMMPSPPRCEPSASCISRRGTRTSRTKRSPNFSSSKTLWSFSAHAFCASSQVSKSTNASPTGLRPEVTSTWTPFALRA